MKNPFIKYFSTYFIAFTESLINNIQRITYLNLYTCLSNVRTLTV